MVGGGPGGSTVAIRPAQAVGRTPVVERETVGGVFLHPQQRSPPPRW